MVQNVFSALEMKTTDFGKVTIRGVRANAYIAMNAQGNLYLTVSTSASISQYVCSNSFCVWLVQCLRALSGFFSSSKGLYRDLINRLTKTLPGS